MLDMTIGIIVCIMGIMACIDCCKASGLRPPFADMGPAGMAMGGVSEKSIVGPVVAVACIAGAPSITGAADGRLILGRFKGMG